MRSPRYLNGKHCSMSMQLLSGQWRNISFAADLASSARSKRAEQYATCAKTPLSQHFSEYVPFANSSAHEGAADAMAKAIMSARLLMTHLVEPKQCRATFKRHFPDNFGNESHASLSIRSWEGGKLFPQFLVGDWWAKPWPRRQFDPMSPHQDTLLHSISPWSCRQSRLMAGFALAATGRSDAESSGTGPSVPRGGEQRHICQ